MENIGHGVGLRYHETLISNYCSGCHNACLLPWLWIEWQI